MQKVILMSFLVGAVLMPTLASKDPRPVRALKRVVLYVFAFNLAYLLAVRFIYPRIL